MKDITWDSRKATSRNAWRFKVLPLKDKDEISKVVDEMFTDVLDEIKLEIAELVGLNSSEKISKPTVEPKESSSDKAD